MEDPDMITTARLVHIASGRISCRNKKMRKKARPTKRWEH